MDNFKSLSPSLSTAIRSILKTLGQGWWNGSLRDAFLGETFMWVMAAAVVAFAIGMNLRVYFVVPTSAFVLCAICVTIIKRRQKK